MDLQQNPGDVFASHNVALVAVHLLRRLALDHHLVLVTTIGCSWVIITIFCIVSSCGTWIGTVSSCSVLIVVACSVWVVLRQLHGLLLSISVHPASSVIAVVVIIIVIDLHELGKVFWLFGLLLVGHFLRMLDRMRWSTGALAGGLSGSGHL
jgi:hypothetical protein